MKGRFITFEGGEGGGKSTQVKKLAAHLSKQNLSVVQTREPGGSEGAEAIRALLVSGDVTRWDGRTEALLHAAARRDHLVKTVWPALQAGSWVICDRFADSTMAYQGYGHGMDLGLVGRLAEIAMDDFRPDLTIILDLPVTEGLKRAANRGGGEDRYERMGAQFHQRLRQGFLDIAANDPNRCIVLDAALPIESLFQAVWDVVRHRFIDNSE